MALLRGGFNSSVLFAAALLPLPFLGLCFYPMPLPLPPPAPSPLLLLSFETPAASFPHSPSFYAQHV